MTITTDNYEEYLYRYMEGELTAEERGRVEAYLAEHPEAAAEMALYDKGLVVEAAPMEYPHKQQLVHKARVVPLWSWAVAACVAAVLLGGVWVMSGRGSQPAAVVAPQGVVAQVMEAESEIASSDARGVGERHIVPMAADTQAEEDPEEPEQVVIEETYEAAAPEPLMAWVEEPMAQPTDEDTTVIEYISIAVLPIQEPLAMAEEVVEITWRDKVRMFNRRNVRLMRDYAYQAGSNLRGEVLTRLYN